MNRRVFRFVVVLVLVFGALASSCFAIRGLSTTKDHLAAGQRSAIRFDLKPYAAGATMSSDRVFMLIGSNLADRKGKVRFNTWEAWHTTVEIDGTGLAAADFSLILRAVLTIQRPAGTGSGEQADFVVFSGG